jgi:hypothetical protein
MLSTKDGMEMFAKLENYCQAHGDYLVVPQRYKEGLSLRMWVASMCNRRDKLDSDRIARLESIGFIWNPLDQQWEEMFAKLKEYCRQHGW